ncbi:MAG TPA: GGDEF domain-containing protein [Spirochaetota bacterium]|nr:GGDEF domain-containing protein [Spirochaetota bacterium]HOM37860.1 GGDEF domain-containing protein [Spirochaetota bacterium]HPQ48664.1 GGDEF domain-containing protein [Spirochaetota bacterium]
MENKEKYLLSLESLLDISILLNSELDFSNVIQSAILTCLGHTVNKYGLIYIKKPLNDFFELSEYKGIENMDINNILKIESNDPFLDFVYKTKKSFEYNKGMSELIDKINPKIIVPLISKNSLVGFMALGEKYSGDFTDDDMEFLDRFSVITANAIENSLLYTLATKDTKTGLYLHHYFLARLKEEIYKSKRYSEVFSLVMIDIDHFKRINDNYGHQAGDYVLEKLGKIILNYVRISDIPSRFGGEEFSVLLPNTDEKGAFNFAERLRVIIENTEFIFKADIIPVTASFGVVEFSSLWDERDIIENADKALYLAKHSGRNNVKKYSDYLREAE